MEEIVAIDRRPLSVSTSEKVVFFRKDVQQPLGDLFRERGVNTLVHLAFAMRPSHDSNSTRHLNTFGAISVLDACAEAAVKSIVYLSSATVYGARHDNPPLLTEDSLVRPVTGFQYALDKALTERIFEKHGDTHQDVRVTVLRSCVVMGPGADNFITQAFAKPFLVAVCGYDPPLQFLHEYDLMELMTLAAREDRFRGVFNLAGRGTVPYSEMVALSGKRLLRVPSLLVYPLVQGAWALRLQKDSPAAGLDFIRYPWLVDTGKVERDTGYRFRYTSREALEAYFS